QLQRRPDLLKDHFSNRLAGAIRGPEVADKDVPEKPHVAFRHRPVEAELRSHVFAHLHRGRCSAEDEVDRVTGNGPEHTEDQSPGHQQDRYDTDEATQHVIHCLTLRSYEENRANAPSHLPNSTVRSCKIKANLLAADLQGWAFAFGSA